MKRRSFLKYSSLFSTPLLVGGLPVSSIARNSLASFINEDNDKVLILIQLNGGNDGLATLVPMNSYDVLANVRSNIIVPENQLVTLDSDLALHPSFGDMKALYDDAKLNIIQNVGYPEQNRSHFRSTDIWHSGSGSNEFETSGWLGRHFEVDHPDYPPQYPNADFPDPFAITVGTNISETCQGLAGNFSIAISDPNNITALASPVNNELADGCAKEQLDFLSNAIEKTNKYGDRIKAAYDAGNNLSAQYGDTNRLGNQLKTVARLISGGLQSKVYVVSIGGFDTHADQTDGVSPTAGIHANLLSDLSNAITAFMDDIKQLGHERKVMGMTYSEFGRRIRSNNSFGTDHGDAAPLFVFGECVDAGVKGQNPQITMDVTQSDGVPMEIDFRSIYGSVLMDWFEVTQEDAQSLFSEPFQYIPITGLCSPPSSTGDLTETDQSIKVIPNPTSDYATLEFDFTGGWAKISILDVMGREMKVICNKKISEGKHAIQIDTSQLSSGTYYVSIRSEKSVKTSAIVKI